MDNSRRRTLAVLALSSAGAVFVWLLRRKPEPDVPTGPGAVAPTSSEQSTLSGPPSYGAPASPPRPLNAPDLPISEAASPAVEPADELYPSPYAEHGPREEARLLELAVEHQEAMLQHAEQRLDMFEEDSDEADLEFEQQLRAVDEGRAQTEAFKRRLKQLDPSSR